MTEQNTNSMAFTDAQSEGWGGAIMHTPNNILKRETSKAYDIVQEQIATTDGMPEPQSREVDLNGVKMTELAVNAAALVNSARI